jgi:hypothetical protein
MKMEFTLQELQYICAALEQRPFIEVAALLANIKQQFAAQQRSPELTLVDTGAASQ